MNMTVGKHETIQELHRGAICSIYSARKVGTPEGEDGASLAIKICQPPVEVLGEAAVGSVISGFLESARLQLGLAQLPAAGANRWLKIHEVVEAKRVVGGGENVGAMTGGAGGGGGGAYCVMDLAKRGSLARIIGSSAKIDERILANVAMSVVEGLALLKETKGRAHGHLKASNVLMLEDRTAATGRVVLSDPAPAALLGTDAFADDLNALGRLLYALTMRREHGGGWPLAASPAWEELGPRGAGWRELTNRLLDPSLRTVTESGEETAEFGLNDVAGAVRALAEGGTSPGRGLKVGVTIAGLVLVGSVAGYLVLGQTSAVAPTPEQLSSKRWMEDPKSAERWQAVCDEYYNWLWSLVKVDRPVQSGVGGVGGGGGRASDAKGFASRREMYESLSPEFLSAISSMGEGGVHPGVIAGLKVREPDFRALRAGVGAGPTKAALSDEGVARTEELTDRIAKLKEFMTEEWPVIVIVRESVAEFQQRGWSAPAMTLDGLDERLVAGINGGEDVAAVSDELTTMVPVLRKIGEAEDRLRVSARVLEDVHDPVVAAFAQSIDRLVAAGLGGPDAPAAELLESIERVDEVGSRLAYFASSQWKNIDVDELFRSEDHKVLAAQVAGAEGGTLGLAGFDAWLKLADRFPALDPESNPIPRVEKSMALLRERMAEYERDISARVPMDLALRQKITRLTADVDDLSELGWIKKNKDRIEADSSTLLKELAAATGSLDGVIGGFKRDAAKSREDLVSQLRSESTVSKDSEAMNREWQVRRDRALERLESAEKDELAATMRTIRAALIELDGQIPALPERSTGEPRWAVEFAGAIVAEREMWVGRALETLKNQELGSSAVIAHAATPAASGFGTWLDRAIQLKNSLSRLDGLLRAGFGLNEQTGSGPSVVELWGTCVGDPLGKEAGVSRAISLVRSRIERLERIEREENANVLLDELFGADEEETEVVLATWERLSSPKIGWPGKDVDLSKVGDLRAMVVSRVSKTVTENGRRNELVENLTKRLAKAWNDHASLAMNAGTGDEAVRAQMLRRGFAAMKNFGVTDERITDTRVRFHAMVYRLRDESGNAVDAGAQAAAGRFVEQAGKLPAEFAQRKDVAAIIAGLRSLASAPAKVKEVPRPESFGPGLDGIPGVSGPDAASVEFNLGGTRLKFLRVELERPGFGADVVYIGDSEVSLEVWIKLVGRTDGKWAQFRTLLDVPEDEEGWYGPRAWVWPSGSPMREGTHWLDAQSPYQSGDGAYEPTLTAEAPRTGSGRRLKDEFGGKPTLNHPMHWVTPSAAIEAAGAVGCRLPTASEWAAAYAKFARDSNESVWNLRDKAFQLQYDYALKIQRASPDKGSFVDYYALPDRFSYAPGTGAPFDLDDRVLWFRPVDADDQKLHNLVGNVAELIYANDDDAARGGRQGVPVAIIGGSALSDRTVGGPFMVPKPITGRDGRFADVGFRLAFGAGGSQAAAIPLAKQIAAILGPKPFVIE